MTSKAFAFVLADNEGAPQLLVLTFDARPDLPQRLPGGRLDEGEKPLVALRREVVEETGLEELNVVRKLGIRRYHKPFIHADVERHDYLLRAPGHVPATFSHTVTGGGGDAGAVFHYQWTAADALGGIDDEFRRDLTRDYIPELFAESTGVASLERSDSRTDESIVIVDHNPAWQDRFAAECTLLQDVFSDEAQIEHFGSTAVPGLGGKPVVDIMVGLPSLREAQLRAAELAWLGYKHVSEQEIPARHYFRKYDSGRRAVHLHCVVRGGTDWSGNLAFRDRLRRDPAIAAEYFALKQALAKQYEADRRAYTNAKRAFIEASLRA